MSQRSNILWVLYLTAFSFIFFSCRQNTELREQYESTYNYLQSAETSLTTLDSISLWEEIQKIPDHCIVKHIELKLLIGSKYLDLEDYPSAFSQLYAAYERSNSNKLNYHTGYALLKLARIFRETKNFDKSNQYIQELIGLSSKLDTANYLPSAYTEFATLEYQKANFQNAFKICEDALTKFPKANPFHKIEWENIMGLIHQKNERHQLAIQHFRTAIKYVETGKFERFGYLYGNLAIAQLALAYPLDTVLANLNLDLEKSLKHGQYESAIITALKLATLYQENGKSNDLILEKIQIADSLEAYNTISSTLDNDLKLRLKVISNMPQTYQQAYLKQLVAQYQQNLDRLRAYNTKKIETINKLALNVIKNEEKEFQIKKTRQLQFYIGLAFALSFLLILSIIAFSFKRRKLEKQISLQEFLTATQGQKIEALQLIEERAKETELKAIKISHYNNKLTEQLIQLVASKNTSPQLSDKAPPKQQITPLQEVPAVVHAKEYEIELAIISQQLSKKLATLTEEEIKYCAYIWLNLGSSEIAKLRGINLASVHKSRNRIRKKLSLDSNIDLKDWLQKLLPTNVISTESTPDNLIETETKNNKTQLS
jgi:DNA-binding CsgD family transcriptional regulator